MSLTSSKAKQCAHFGPFLLEPRLFQKGLLVLQCGESVLRMAPPLVIDEVDVDLALQIFDECLSERTR